jgi:hypothetical protein
LARSGEDAADWLTQIPRVERDLGIDVHVLLIVDLPDLYAAVDAPVPPPSTSDVAQANRAIAAILPAFVIQAVRHLLTEADETTRRQLRFSVGPVHDGARAAVRPVSTPAAADRESEMDRMLWTAPITALAEVTHRPLVVLYAPKSPQILHGRVVKDDPSTTDFDEMRIAAENVGVRVVDARTELLQSAVDGHWPHGFQNGHIGSGHLNRIGNQITASKVVAATEESIEQGN